MNENNKIKVFEDKRIRMDRIEDNTDALKSRVDEIELQINAHLGITAAVLGGVAFSGGVGNMLGVFIGILLLSSFQNGLVVAGVDAFYQFFASGLLLIGALVLNYYRENA